MLHFNNLKPLLRKKNQLLQLKEPAYYIAKIYHLRTNK